MREELHRKQFVTESFKLKKFQSRKRGSPCPTCTEVFAMVTVITVFIVRWSSEERFLSQIFWESGEMLYQSVLLRWRVSTMAFPTDCLKSVLTFFCWLVLVQDWRQPGAPNQEFQRRPAAQQQSALQNWLFLDFLQPGDLIAAEAIDHSYCFQLLESWLF